MLWTVIVVLLMAWLLGLLGSIGGSYVHLLLIAAAVVLVVQLLQGRRAA
ncbi:MAG: lmo0937 family membrane protein [Chloroflexi bacterium]|nr:lmo0937 family membrane protein [Chloroflexota bacterium]